MNTMQSHQWENHVKFLLNCRDEKKMKIGIGHDRQ